ncbi:hypothetical protein K438DRAFT_1965701 [Mycena galopus ATCC 62051]|nr:hypothetical protein K438DRAFT_1965701 [Mycena galopus ATCC 62051]
MTIFAQELIDEIIDHLAWVSKKSLKTCSLVSWAWLPRSRSHLFRTCTLSPDNIFHFCDLLRSPGCTFLDHVMKINLPHHDSRRFNGIAAVLRRLTRVCALEMAFPDDTMETHTFGPTGFAVAFLHVTSLVLAGPGSPAAPLPDIISRFPALRDLEIRDLGVVDDFPTTAVPPQGLHSLKLCDSSMVPVLQWLRVSDHLPRVDSVALPVLRLEDAPLVRAAMQQLAGTLSHLDITLTCNHRPFDIDASIVYDLSLHPNLRTLVIRDFSRFLPDDHNADRVRTMRVITRLAAPTLESLSIDFDRWIFNWDALDALLSTGRFPHLREVIFKSTDDQFKFLAGILPLLQASAVLKMMTEFDERTMRRAG